MPMRLMSRPSASFRIHRLRRLNRVSRGHHCFATITQRGMCLTLPDGWPVPPTACTPRERSFRYGCADLLRLFGCEVAQDEKLFQFFTTDCVRHFGVRLQYHG